ncbi:MAG: hypothetical protein DLM61_18920 [Pseudonocardiales bacterium]|nr:MAG: hypothetical protein DLM61_18920 [Pseudonocardiales bacterium]
MADALVMLCGSDAVALAELDGSACSHSSGSMPRLPTLEMTPPSLPLHRAAPDPRRAVLHTHPVDPGFRWVAWCHQCLSV